MRRTAAAVSHLPCVAANAQDAGQLVQQARKRWAESPHGPMLGASSRRPRAAAAPRARVAARASSSVLVQCHNLPNPAMHQAAKWPGIFERMVVRMRARAIWRADQDMMAGMEAPSVDESGNSTRYLRKHSQRPLDPKNILRSICPKAQSFKLACQHATYWPDPALQGVRVACGVARMEKNMEWMNIVVGNPTRGRTATEDRRDQRLPRQVRGGKADQEEPHPAPDAGLAPIASNHRFTLGKLV